MGAAHALAYHALPDFEIVGLVSRGVASREALDRRLGGGHALFADFAAALAATRPEVASLNTYPETHAEYPVRAPEAGAHVFLEKPLATSVEDGRRVIRAAQAGRRKLVVGYILRHHPSWIRFIEVARSLGRPLVMRMNLNQQSSG